VAGIVVASVVLGARVALSQRPDFAKADADTVRLPPAAFPDLPGYWSDGKWLELPGAD
jgi:hypothetical protein